MNACLGIYVDNNIVKYAKVAVDASKHLRVDSYGMKFRSLDSKDDLPGIVAEIVKENNALEIPISTNIYGENYDYFNIISRLSKKDIQGVLDIEFSELCAVRNQNPQKYSYKYYLGRQIEDISTMKTTLISIQSDQLDKIQKGIGGYKLNNINPTSMSITNLVQDNSKDYIVLNLEDNVQATIVVNGQILKVISMPIGMGNIISKIQEETNSLSSSYELCKGMTIYNPTTEDDINVSGEYKNVIEVTLQDMFQRLDKEMLEYKEYIKNIYITGSGLIFNNIDLLIFDYFNIKTTILKPYFLNPDLPAIKEIIESNSAISLALEGIKATRKDLNFYKPSKLSFLMQKDNLKGVLKPKTPVTPVPIDMAAVVDNNLEGQDKPLETIASDIDTNKTQNQDLWAINSNNMDVFTAPIETEIPVSNDAFVDTWLTRASLIIGTGLITYLAVTLTVSTQMFMKESTMGATENALKSAIAKYQKDTQDVKDVTKQYKTITDLVDSVTGQVQSGKLSTYNVAMFMQELMSIIPKGASVVEIKTNDSKHLTITVSSSSYADLGYLLSKMKLDGVLKNIKTEGVEQGQPVKIVISGDLP